MASDQCKAAPGDDSVAMLPHTSLSPWAVVILLGRWAYSSSHHGGMSKEARRRACGDLLDSILGHLAEGARDVRIVVSLVASFGIKYHRPEVPTAPVHLTISSGGMVGLRSFWLQVRIASAGMAHGWWCHKDMAKLEGSMAAYLGRGRLGAERVARWLLRPTLGGPSGQEDHGRLHALPGQLGPPPSYLMACRNAASSETFFSCCTDKSVVAGLGSGLQSKEPRSVCPAAGISHSGVCLPRRGVHVQIAGLPPANPNRGWERITLRESLGFLGILSSHDMFRALVFSSRVGL